jgi:hypothetical protein
LPPPLRVRLRSARSKPLIASLNTIVIVLTLVVRGSGVISVMSTVGIDLSIV